MSIKLRMSRGGRKGAPFYRIVAADSRAARDGKYLERLGTYDPRLPHDREDRVVLNADRIKHWLSVGAQPSERVAIFLGKAGIIAMPEQPNRPNKSKPKAKAQEMLREKEEKAAAKVEAEAAAKAAAEEAAKAPAEAPAEESAPAETATEAPAEEAPAAAEAKAE